jgi:hypothetical protein
VDFKRAFAGVETTASRVETTASRVALVDDRGSVLVCDHRAKRLGIEVGTRAESTRRDSATGVGDRQRRCQIVSSRVSASLLVRRVESRHHLGER